MAKTLLGSLVETAREREMTEDEILAAFGQCGPAVARAVALGTEVEPPTMYERADRIRKALAAHGDAFGSIIETPVADGTAVAVRLRLEWLDLDDQSTAVALDVVARGGHVQGKRFGWLRAEWALGEVSIGPEAAPRRGRPAKRDNHFEGDKK